MDKRKLKCPHNTDELAKSIVDIAMDATDDKLLIESPMSTFGRMGGLQGQCVGPIFDA